MTPASWASLAAIVFSAIAGLLVYRLNRILDGQENTRNERDKQTETRLRAVEMAIAGDLMTKDDMTLVMSRLDKLDDSLDKLKDMVARMEEREKVRHERT